MKTKSAIMGKIGSILFLAVWMAPLLVFAGCASQYDCYTCGRVCCNYCPPKPLPYSTYESCNCTDSIGQAYAATLWTKSHLKTAPDHNSNSDYDTPELETKGNGAKTRKKDVNANNAENNN